MTHIRATSLIALISLSACAPTLSMSNEAGGVINQRFSMGSDRAYKIAEAECAKYGKLARITSDGVISNRTRYECVSR